MPVTIFAENLLEDAVSEEVQPPANVGRYFDRLWDRDRDMPYQGGAQQAWGMPVAFPLPLAMVTATETTMKFTLAAAAAPKAWAWINPLFTATAKLYADAALPVTTERDALAVTSGINVIRYVPIPVTALYWQVRIPIVAIAAGELMLGTPRVISKGPFYKSAGAEESGNVAHDPTRANYLYSAELGPGTTRLTYSWPALEAADAAALLAAWEDCRRGRKRVLLSDGTGQLRWCAWLNRSVKPIPLGRGRFAFEDQIFEETALSVAA